MRIPAIFTSRQTSEPKIPGGNAVSRLPLSALLLVGFIVAFLQALYQAFFLISPLEHLYSDMLGYIERSWRLGIGASFVPFDVFYPAGTAYAYAPLFSLFGFSSGLYAIIVLQCLMLAGNIVLLGLIADQLYGGRRAALLAMAFGVLYWPFAAQAGFFMSEPLFEFLLLLGLYHTIVAVKEGGSTRAFAAGLSYGAACLFKGQGLVMAAAGGLAFLLFGRKAAYRKELPIFCLATVLPILLQMAVNSAILGGPAPFLAANDAFNAYLGQSRREGIGCADLENNMFYVFHNNNAGLPYRLFPPVVLPISILDRDAFQDLIAELWAVQPGRQLLYSLENMVELFAVNPRWPLRNASWAGPADVAFQWGFFAIVTIPCFYTLAGALRRRREHFPVVLLLGPIAGLAVLTAMTMGQPRYLLPFQYLLILLALPFYLDIFGYGESSKSSGRFGLRASILALLTFHIIAGALIYRSLSPQPSSAAALTLKAPPSVDGPLAVVTFGLNGNLTHWEKGAHSYRLLMGGFDPIKSSRIAGSEAVSANTSGWLTLEFDGTETMPPERIALYMVDEAADVSNVEIKTKSGIYFAEAMSQGRWIEIPLSEQELNDGRVTLRFRRLTGGRIIIKQLMVYGAR